MVRTQRRARKYYGCGSVHAWEIRGMGTHFRRPIFYNLSKTKKSSNENGHGIDRWRHYNRMYIDESALIHTKCTGIRSYWDVHNALKSEKKTNLFLGKYYCGMAE